MEPKPRVLEVYEKSPGVFPFDDWLVGLRDVKGQNIIEIRLDRIEKGNLGYCRPVGEGVLELKIDFGPGYRVYLAEDGVQIILLLIGGDKSTQSKDIKTAKAYWQDHKEKKDALKKLQDRSF